MRVCLFRDSQLALPYVEPADCAALSEGRIVDQPDMRSVSLFFAGAQADFDTTVGCPNVANHSIRVRQALLSLGPQLPSAELRALPHNLRHCNNSVDCQHQLKRRAATGMARSRFCPVAAGDTPTTGTRGWLGVLG